MAKKPKNKRRDFLQLSTVTLGAVGTAAFIWPFLKSMNPAEDTLAAGSTEVDISEIEEGQSITIKWRGKPVFIKKRTKDEIDAAKMVQASDLRELDVTSVVNPGQNHSFDYGVVNASGSSNYWVSSQLVSYGDINHTLDASVSEILSPTNHPTQIRKNPICSKPKIIIQNTGSTILTSLKIEYWINNSSNKEIYQ